MSDASVMAPFSSRLGRFLEARDSQKSATRRAFRALAGAPADKKR